MISKKNLEILKKQHYAIAGKHSCIQICRWTKKSLIDEGVCYKEKFYGIKSHRCAEISPSAVWCQNKCLHCWRAIENTQKGKLDKKKVDMPKEIIKECLIGREKLLSGFGGNKKLNKKKFKEAQLPNQFAISLIGEPTLYPYICEMVKMLKKEKKSTFIVTNGLNPNVLKEMQKKKCLPTQLYISLNTPNKELYDRWHRSSEKNAWKKFNQSLEIMKNLKTRTAIRMTLVRDLNMAKEQANDFARLLKKASPMFIEVKGFMSVGYARKRLGYEKMPNWKEVQDYAKLIAKAINYKILDKHEFSRVVLLGKSKKDMKIKGNEI